MYVRPVHPSNSFDSYISGEVEIHPSAAIAPGVLLQASPDSRIIIGPGVCIGLGSIIHAHEGILEVEAGANLGAGVLVVGKGTIGANACIGSTTTIQNRSVEPGQVVVAGSLIGDESRQIRATPTAAIADIVPREVPPSQTSAAATANSNDVESVTNSSATPTASSEESAQTTSESTQSESESQQDNGVTVSGQAHLNRMLSTMFPNRKYFGGPQNSQSPS